MSPQRIRAQFLLTVLKLDSAGAWLDLLISGITELSQNYVEERQLPGRSVEWPLPLLTMTRAPLLPLALTRGFWARRTAFLLSEPMLGTLRTQLVNVTNSHITLFIKVTSHPVWSCRCFRNQIKSVILLLVERMCALSWQILCHMRQSPVAERRFMNKMAQVKLYSRPQRH